MIVWSLSLARNDMRILIVGINYAPELTGIGKYSSEMAEWLAATGHQVRVVTAPPYYPEWRVADGYAAWRYGNESRRGVSVWRCPIWIPARPSGLKRLLHLASFALSSFPVMLRQIFWRPDVIITIEPPLFCAPAAWLCARLSGARAWLHVQDFEVDAAFDLGILKAQWMRRIVSKSESWLMRRFDRVSTISPNMVRRLIQKDVAPERAVLFTNWVDIDAIFPMNAPSAMRQQLGVASGTVVALYSGNMGEKQGLEIVLEAATRLVAEQDVQFVLCGDGAARERLQQKYAGLSNVRWLPLQPLERLNDLLNMADIHLLPQRSGAEDLVMPSKLTGMLASGRPVIATANSGTQIARVLPDCGVLVEPNNIGQFTGAILQLAHNAPKRNEMGKHAREYALAHWAIENVLQEFDKQLREM
ncbi:D-inositol 3-phosphate glycosyltransferase [mine drainage metagenome]|uniref:D-inositol 3-phosphate glycosyltransferase n=1 Tax=mine drainage metagenome TaxID=410659 RepID=A0A1J5TE44_9ZZZZ